MSKNSFDKYLDDPDIINEPMPLREIHAIRLMIHDETKNMTPEQRRAYYTDGLDEVCRQFNIKVVPSVSQR